MDGGRAHLFPAAGQVKGVHLLYDDWWHRMEAEVYDLHLDTVGEVVGLPKHYEQQL
jgi:hypothetical protein